MQISTFCFVLVLQDERLCDYSDVLISHKLVPNRMQQKQILLVCEAAFVLRFIILNSF